MALLRAGGGYKPPTREEYEQKKKMIFSKINRETERIWNGMIYCRFCHEPKVADFPERNRIMACCCKCEVERWERSRRMALNPHKAKEIRCGDWNPFDGGEYVR